MMATKVVSAPQHGSIQPASASNLEAGTRYAPGWGSRFEAKRAAAVGRSDGRTYEEIRAQCLQENCLFEDSDFPANDSSIFFSRKPPRPFVWKRPQEICADPQFFVGGASRFDVQQGELGDCWLLAAIASLSQFSDLLNRVVPPDQGFSVQADSYAGIFRFNFWQYGKWTEIVIDDRVPTYNGRLVFMHSSVKNEFWSSLLEKAYAKLNGSYENLKGGSTSEAMEDFTGGVTEMFDIRQNAPPNLFQIMFKANERSSLMGCSIDADPNKVEAELPNGLIMGHAYSITGVKMVDVQTAKVKGKIPLIRVRNPWGNECEWKGAWSDKSSEWKLISDAERQNLGLTFSDDGEFWMSFQDFSKNFQKVEICNLGPDSVIEEASDKKTWEMTGNEGCWKKRVNAGGCRNFLETFWTNPQYRVTVTDPDEDDDENLGTVIVALMQKDRRKKRSEGLDMLTVGYCVYKLKDPNCGPLNVDFFKFNASVAKSPSFINMREVCGRHRLEPGTYCIVPSTFEPNQEGDFLLRVYCEKAVQSNELDEQTRMVEKKPVEPTPKESAADKEMREAFKKIAGEDMEVDAYELQDILNATFKRASEFPFDGFTADTCRSLVAMKDVDRSGKLGYDEFKRLWSDIRVWKLAFKNQDKDKSGTFNSFELRETLREIGVSVSNSTFNSLVLRYSHRDGKIYFDDYVHCIARLCTMFDIYKEMSAGSSKAQFSLDEFIATTMYS